MKYLTILLILAIATVTHAATMAEQLAVVQAAPGVLAAEITKPATPIQGFNTLSLAEVTYYLLDSGIVSSNAIEMIVVDQGKPTEAGYWTRRLPTILRQAPVPEKYITDRTVSFTATQIEAFCNAVWRSANSGADDIIEFVVTTIDGRTVRVSGKFDVGAELREQREYYIWLVDPNGSVAPGNANVKFQRIAP